jgi:small subunit ribosomal protein S4
MGAPKKHRRKYSGPKKPYDRSRLERERKIRQEFGLRRKKEIWRTEGMLRKFRQRARELQAKPNEQEQKLLFDKINKMGISCSKLEDVLVIELQDVLSRRLQTIVYKKGLAHTPQQARQYIVHGHVFIDGRKAVWPSYIVEMGQEDRISLNAKITQVQLKEQEGEKK